MNENNRKTEKPTYKRVNDQKKERMEGRRREREGEEKNKRKQTNE